MTDKKLSIHDRIKIKEKEIKEAEDLLDKLNEEIQELYDEKIKEEAAELFMKIKDKGLSIDETLDLLT